MSVCLILRDAVGSILWLCWCLDSTLCAQIAFEIVKVLRVGRLVAFLVPILSPALVDS